MRKPLLAVLAIATSLTASPSRAGPSYSADACVDEAGHFASCTEYECYYANGDTNCIGKIVPATARCIDGSATASSKPENTCRTHGGVWAWFAAHCVDEAGHAADCTIGTTANGGTEADYAECAVAADELGRCYSDPLCHNAEGHGISCTGKVVPATASCTDGTATASPVADQACMAHGGVSARYYH